MSKKVLILSASAGAGQLRAAQAIERAFAETGSAQSVHNYDTLEFTNPLFRRLYAKASDLLICKQNSLRGVRLMRQQG